MSVCKDRPFIKSAKKLIEAEVIACRELAARS